MICQVHGSKTARFSSPHPEIRLQQLTELLTLMVLSLPCIESVTNKYPIKQQHHLWERWAYKGVFLFLLDSPFCQVSLICRIFLRALTYMNFSRLPELWGTRPFRHLLHVHQQHTGTRSSSKNSMYWGGFYKCSCVSQLGARENLACSPPAFPMLHFWFVLLNAALYVGPSLQPCCIYCSWINRTPGSQAAEQLHLKYREGHTLPFTKHYDPNHSANAWSTCLHILFCTGSTSVTSVKW